jgi:hypothetical protein
MKFVRENLFYVILAAVAVLGGGLAIFYYLGSDISRTLQSRTSVSSQLQALAGQPLKADPNAVEAMKARIRRLSEANKADLEACLKFNRENLPVMKLKPEGRTIDEIRAFPFNLQQYNELRLYFTCIQQYTKEFNQVVAPSRPGLWATTPPTSEEIQAEKNKLAEKFKNLADEKAIQSATLHKAEKGGLVYFDPSATGALHRVFTHETTASAEQLWEAQVNLWLTDEIIRAIITTNGKWIAEQQAENPLLKPSVLNSAVKHIENIKINDVFTAQKTGPAKLSLTQRESCSTYAVVPYSFTVIMPTRHVRRLIGVLEAQNYHTVTNIALSEAPSAAKEGYYYGIEPVMRVQVDGEMLLLADWIRDLMPASLAVQYGKVGS